jgi:hypothetical protein
MIKPTLLLRMTIAVTALACAGFILIGTPEPNLDAIELVADGPHWKRAPFPAIQQQNPVVFYSQLVDYNQDIFQRTRRDDAWNAEVRLTTDSGGDDKPVYVSTGEDSGWLFWEAERGSSWVICGRRFDGGRWEPECIISSRDQRSRAVCAGIGAGNRLWVAWEAYAGKRVDIYARSWTDEGFSNIQKISTDGRNSYNPSLAVHPDHDPFIVWQQFDGQRFRIMSRQYREGDWRQETILSDPDYPANEVHPTAILDDAGRLWAAWEREMQYYYQTALNWAETKSSHYNHKIIMLRCLEQGRWKVPLSPLEDGSPGQMTTMGYDSYPRLMADTEGRIWLYYYSSQRAQWRIFGYCLAAGGWSPRIDISANLPGWRQDARLMPVSGDTFYAVWQRQRGQGSWMTTEERVQENDLHARAFRMAPGTMGDPGALLSYWSIDDYRSPAVAEGLPPLTGNTELEGIRRTPDSDGTIPPWTVRRTGYNTRQQHRDSRPSITYDGTTYYLYWGDLHRHTELSTDNRWRNGSLEDHYQYGTDVEGLDFMAITDHAKQVWSVRDRKNVVHAPPRSIADMAQLTSVQNVYKWFETRQMAKFCNIDGYLTAFSGYEWTPNNLPMAHHNVIFSTDDYPYNYPFNDPRTDDPAKLWKQLRKDRARFGGDVFTLPHSTATLLGPSYWNYYDPELMPLVEFCQHRGNYEKAGGILLPQPNQRQVEEGFVQNGWAKDQRFGIVGSGDHFGRQLAAVWATDLTREAIFKALKNKRCYATFGEKILIDFRLNGRIMGEEILVTEPSWVEPRPTLDIRVEALEPLRSVTVVRNNRDIQGWSPGTTSATYTWTDTTSLGGGAWYYIRVEQENDEAAWSSPIWITRE